MNIGIKNILINKNINKVKDDLQCLTEIRGLKESNNKFNIFYGELKENSFIFYNNSILSRFDTPEFHGELTELNSNETLIKINIISSKFDITLCISLQFFGLLLTVTNILPNWSALLERWGLSSIILDIFYNSWDINSFYPLYN